MYRLRYFMYRNRYALRRVYLSLVTCLIIMTMSMAVIYEPSRSGIVTAAGKLAEAGADLALRCGERDPRGLMRAAIPALAWAGSGEDMPELLTPRSLLTALLAPFRVNIGTPLDLVKIEIPLLGEYNPEVATVVVKPAPEDDFAGSTPPVLTDKALVGIYHTHTGETYALTDGTERLSGKKGGVVTVGEAIKDELEKEYGIRVAHSDRVNDEIYNSSYAESEKDARRLLAENPDLEILLDIHRDAGKPRKDSIVNINGRELAPILFVVGSDARAPFPTWKQNHDFAKKIAEAMEKKYPGLCIGVRVKEGRYNQFLHPGAMLVEVGSVSNSTEEAAQSARLLAGILAAELKSLAPDKLSPAATGQGADKAESREPAETLDASPKRAARPSGITKTGSGDSLDGKEQDPATLAGAGVFR